MSLSAESLTGRIIAVVSRRSPAFVPPANSAARASRRTSPARTRNSSPRTTAPPRSRGQRLSNGLDHPSSAPSNSAVLGDRTERTESGSDQAVEIGEGNESEWSAAPWGTEEPTATWPWRVDSPSVPTTWDIPPAPGAMDFPAAESPDIPAAPLFSTGADFAAADRPELEKRAEPGRSRLAVLAGAFVVVLLAAGGLSVALHGPMSKPEPSANGLPTASTVTTIEPTSGTPTDLATGGPSDQQGQALAELEQIYEQDRGGVNFEGQYVAQLASKYPGIVDPLQTTADGSHRFEAEDILAQFQELKADHGSTAHPVVLLKSTDYGKRQKVDGHFLWVSFALGDFPSAQAVQNWCKAEFPDLSTADREGQCATRRLEPAQ